MARLQLAALLLVTLLTTLAACNRNDGPLKVDPAKVEQQKRDAPDKMKTGGIRLAVGGMITPKEGFAYYREFLDYISRQMGEPVHYVDAESYEDINQKLKRSELDGGFVCSGPYVDGRKEFGLELLAAPQAYGKTQYYAYIIVPNSSPAKSLDDLKGRSFAFTDPLSNTGHLVPEYMLARKGVTPEKFFSKIVYSGSHDKSINAVSQGLVDGASVDSLIWDYTNRTRPAQTAGTRIVQKSEPYAIPPFVVRPGLAPETRQKLKSVLLNAHTNPEGRAILQKMMIDQFVSIDDRAYDSIRQMKRITGK